MSKPKRHRPQSGGGLSETACLPDSLHPTYTYFESLPEWIDSIYLKAHDRTYIVSFLGKRIVIS